MFIIHGRGALAEPQHQGVVVGVGRNQKTLKALLNAALTIPYLAYSESDSHLGFHYGLSKDKQRSGDRMKVKAPSFFFKSAIGDDKTATLEGGYTADTMTGASPVYLTTLSGASEKGIRDTRHAGELKFTKKISDYSFGVGAGLSYEDDYKAHSILGDFKWHRGSTDFFISASYSDDKISSTNAPFFKDERQTAGVLLGFSKAISELSEIKTALSMINSDGYLSDPYKYGDIRPRSREQYILLLELIHILPQFQSELKFQFKHHYDSWEINSNAVEIEVGRALSDTVKIIPRIRYYTQDSADFFATSYPQTSEAPFYSADQRLSRFGALEFSLGIETKLTDDLSIRASVGAAKEAESLGLYGGNSVDLEPLYIKLASLTVLTKF